MVHRSCLFVLNVHLGVYLESQWQYERQAKLQCLEVAVGAALEVRGRGRAVAPALRSLHHPQVSLVQG